MDWPSAVAPTLELLPSVAPLLSTGVVGATSVTAMVKVSVVNAPLASADSKGVVWVDRASWRGSGGLACVTSAAERSTTEWPQAGCARAKVGATHLSPLG